MNIAIEQFNFLMKDTRQISNVYQHFNLPILDDLLRWQWTQSVSALDKYIHDVIRVGVIMTYTKQIIPTRSFSNFLIPLSILEDPVLISTSFEQFVVRKLSYSSYQTPDKINEGLSLIWSEEHKWQCIADNMNLPKSYLTTKLNLIAQRRNQIVHQGDYPSYHLEKEELTMPQVTEVTDFIEKLVKTIHLLLSKEFNERKII